MTAHPVEKPESRSEKPEESEPDFIKLFTVVIYKCLFKAKVFNTNLGKSFQLNLRSAEHF